MFRHGRARIAANVADGDARALRRRLVDDIRPRRRHSDQFQMGQARKGFGAEGNLVENDDVGLARPRGDLVDRRMLVFAPFMGEIRPPDDDLRRDGRAVQKYDAMRHAVPPFLAVDAYRRPRERQASDLRGAGRATIMPSDKKTNEETMFENLFSLDGRIAIVTGGSRGIGKMIAGGLLAYGARRVYITARKAAACDAAAAELTKAYAGECISIPCDISTLEGIGKLSAALAAREDRIDILVNNAGAAWAADFDAFPENGWDKVVDLNMKTPFFLTQALTPLLKAAATDHLAKVINIASIDGVSNNPQETYSYQASKAGLIHLTRRMALKLAPERIGVSAIAPGAFASTMNKDARDHADEVAQRIPAGRIGTPEDMAGAAIYLASRAGDYVTGATLVVDGGVTWARG